MYLRPPCYDNGLNFLQSCLFGNIRDTFVIHKKAKFVSFIYMRPQKMKFKSVQINMKLVS